MDQSYAYTVSRYVAKEETLKTALQRQTFNQERAVDLIRQVAAALAYAHQHGVVHGNVKPSNILLDNGQALLSDFGLARIEEASTKLTYTGALMGTPAYMSPEQAAGTSTDMRSDIYSLGLILYELLTGAIPHNAETPLAIMLQRVTKPPTPPRTLNPAISESLEQVILRALAIKPEDRYNTATDFRLALQEATAPKASPEFAAKIANEPDTPATPQPPSEAVSPKKSLKNRWSNALRAWFKSDQE